MSTDLYWLPYKEPEGKSLYSLKRLMAKRLSSDNDGSLPENLGIVDKEWIEFLEGVAAANDDMKEDAEELIEAIKNHGKVELYIQ